MPLAELFTLQSLLSLLMLTVMEIVLGVDNVIFISIVAQRLPKSQQPTARSYGILLALAARVALLFGITWIIGLKEPFFTTPQIGSGEWMVAAHPFSGKDLILIFGGLFLIAKTTSEIHHKLEGEEEQGGGAARKRQTLQGVIVQIMLIDIVFSFDSILTAVGLVKDNLPIMVTAVVISMGVMYAFAGKISDYIESHPTIKMLALSFLILIGFMLVIEGFGQEVEKGYIYFAMAFSLGVEMLNMRVRTTLVPRPRPVDDPYGEEDDDAKPKPESRNEA